MTVSALSFWGFSTPAMDQIFDADHIVAAILRFEAALALALSDTGIAPQDEAEAVASACAEPAEDASGLLGSTWETGTPLLAIVDVVRSRLANDDDRRWVHYGATTQDAIDTAHMLLVREALGHLDNEVTGLALVMRGLVEQHRDQPQMGRTFLQQARPTTFGMRVAGWLDPLLTHIENLRVTKSGLAIQLGGPVGNLAEYGPKGTAVVEALAKRLELKAPTIPWHTDRSRVRLVVDVVENSTSSLSKVANDVSLLAQSTVGEVTTRAGGSSAMPNKKNPIDAVRALSAAEICRGAGAIVRGAPPHALDRSLGSWQAEWIALPLLFSSAATVVESVVSLLNSLEVDAATMGSRVEEAPDLDPGLIDGVLERCSELT